MSFLQHSKLAFLFHIPEMYFHYRPVLGLLPKDSFDIIVPDSPEEALLNIMEAEAYQYAEIGQLLAANIRYKYLVSDHCFLNDYKLMGQLGSRQIRFISELGLDRLQFHHINLIYDMFLCFGRYQERKLKFCKNAWHLNVGCPRYDYYYNNYTVDEFALKQEFYCDPNKPVILWLPGFDTFSSIEYHIEQVTRLLEFYNVIVKPHPYTILEEPERLSLLHSSGFNAIITAPFDDLHLLLLADYVLADYGQGPFSALYTEKKLILLNVPRAHEHEFLGLGSSDITLRNYFRSLDAESRFDDWVELIEDEYYWENQNDARIRTQARYFHMNYGNAAKTAANILLNIESYLF